MTRAAVLGLPVAHSLSPALHNAGYAAAGLTSWRYTAVDCAEDELAGFVAGLDASWAGLSLTMPLKEVALAVAGSASPVAVAIGAANTLVHRPDGSWYADNTDVSGMTRVLTDAGLHSAPSVAVLGGGGTARAALAAAASFGATEVTVVTRRPTAISELATAAGALGVRLTGLPWEQAPDAFGADAVISTVPRGVADPLATAVSWRRGVVLVDAIYDPWPTPLTERAIDLGRTVVTGIDLLAQQAVLQVRLMTGHDVPVDVVRNAALRAIGSG